MTTSFHIVIFLLSSFTLLMSETLRYWDLGVHIDKNSQTMVQKELAFDQIANINTSATINLNYIVTSSYCMIKIMLRLM